MTDIKLVKTIVFNLVINLTSLISSLTIYYLISYLTVIESG